jgi:hypothetical protein
MKAKKFNETEVFEADRTFDFPDGVVTLKERATREVIRFNKDRGIARTGENGTAPPTRLIVGGAIARTKGFVAKTRDEIGELSAILQELTGSYARIR